MKVSSRGNAPQEGTEVVGGGVLVPLGPTSLTSPLSTKPKRHSHLWHGCEICIGGYCTEPIKLDFSGDEKNKKDLSALCGCEAFDDVHVKGLCEALKR